MSYPVPLVMSVLPSVLLNKLPKEVLRFHLLPFLRCICGDSFDLPLDGPVPCGNKMYCSLQKCCIRQFNEEQYNRLGYSIVGGCRQCMVQWRDCFAALDRLRVDHAAIVNQQREEYFRRQKRPISCMTNIWVDETPRDTKIGKLAFLD